MPMDFPASPTIGQQYNGYVWTGVAWDSTSAQPISVATTATGYNYIINGAFEINQRNFASTTTNATYGFDRWRTDFVGGTITSSAQSFTVGQLETAATPAQNFLRVVTTGQSAAGDYVLVKQPIEDVRTLAGQTVTVSFWARAASGTPKVSVELQQQFVGSSAVNTDAGQVTLSTSWARYSVTTTLPSASGKTLAAGNNLGLHLWVSAGSNFSARTGSMGVQSNTFEFWGVQVEEGAAATDFRRNAPSLQAELAACQRYYYRNTVPNRNYFVGQAVSPTAALITYNFPVTMRVRATSAEYAGLILTGPGASAITLTGLGTSYSSENSMSFVPTCSSGLTAGNATTLVIDNGYIGISAEL